MLVVCLAAVAPLGFILELRAPARIAGIATPAPTSFTAAVAEVCRHPGYVLMSVGFFSCGLQLAFIATHLPGYLTLCHMPLGQGATTLATIGLLL